MSGAGAELINTRSTAPDREPSYERRWRRLWEAMEREGVGAVAVYGRGSLGAFGLHHALSGHFAPPRGGFALVERGRPPRLVAGSELELGLLAESSRAAGVEVVLGPEPGSAAAAGALLADAAGDDGAALAAPPGGVPVGELELLRDAAGRDLVDFSAAVDAIRAAVEPEDIAALADAVAGAEAAIERFAAGFAIGISEREAAALIDAELSRRGALTRMVFVSGGRFRGRPPGERPLRAGEPISVLVEQASPSGHWVEIGVIAAAGLAPAGERVAETCIETLRIAERGLRPGADCGELARAMLDSLRDGGGRQISGLGHGTGVDEGGPVLVAGERAEVRPGTAFSVHPSYAPLADAEGPSATLANTFLVEPDRAGGARPLSELPYRVLELG